MSALPEMARRERRPEADKTKIIADRIREAMRTVRHLPSDKPAGHRAAWPNIVRRVSEAYGYTRTALPSLPPTPAMIDRMDEALDWLWILGSDDRRLVVARACAVPVKILAKNAHCSRETIRRKHQQALEIIARTVCM